MPLQLMFLRGPVMLFSDLRDELVGGVHFAIVTVMDGCSRNDSKLCESAKYDHW